MMEFRKMFKEPVVPEIKKIQEVKLDAESVLIDGGFKIKTKFGTKFGTEFVLAKKYPQSDIEDALKDFNFKIDGNSVFVEKD